MTCYYSVRQYNKSSLNLHLSESSMIKWAWLPSFPGVETAGASQKATMIREINRPFTEIKWVLLLWNTPLITDKSGCRSVQPMELCPHPLWLFNYRPPKPTLGKLEMAKWWAWTRQLFITSRIKKMSVWDCKSQHRLQEESSWHDNVTF